MATNMPPHNMREVIDAAIWMIESAQEPTPPTLSEKQRKLLELVPGPDFPTGGYIVGRQGIRQAYLTGRGAVIMRAKTEIEVSKKGDRSSIVIDEIPYQVNKARLIERIAELVREKTIEGISDIRDESDRDGLRIVIELKRGEVGDVILNNLYKHTALQSSFGIIMLAIVGGRPKVLSLVELIDNFVEFRREVVRRRTEFELRKAEARRHILEGLRIALDHIDAVITLIRSAPNPGDGARWADGAVRPQSDPGPGHPGHAAAAADRPRAAEDSRRAGGAARVDRTPAGDPLEREARDADHRRRASGRARETRGRSAHGDSARKRASSASRI